MNWVTLTYEPWMPIGADKAKEDFAQAATGVGFKILHIDRASQTAHLRGLTAGDLVIHQYPSYLSDDWELTFEQELQHRGILFAILIHDFEPLRLTAQSENLSAFQLMRQADLLVVHNQRMQQALANLNTHIFQIGLFDYLCNAPDHQPTNITHELVYAGSLAKAPWLQHYTLPMPLTVFGRVPRTWDFSAAKTIQIKDPIDPAILPASLPTAWGLVWDEDLDPSKTHYQDYEKINSPHKLSLYLTAGLPVIIWKHAALASFVETRHLGLTINQLSDITDEAVQNCQVDFKRLAIYSKKIRQGYFTQRLIGRILKRKQAIPDDCRPK